VTRIDLELTRILARAPNRRLALRVAVSRQVDGVYLTVILNQVFLAANGAPCEGRILTALRKARRAEEGAVSEPAIFDVEDIGRDIYCLARSVRPMRLCFTRQFLLRARPSRERVLHD
jgi:hypothetical protein